MRIYSQPTKLSSPLHNKFFCICVVSYGEHKFSKLGWHFKGIRRALSSLTFADAKYLRFSRLHLHNPRHHDGCCQSIDQVTNKQGGKRAKGHSIARKSSGEELAFADFTNVG